MDSQVSPSLGVSDFRSEFKCDPKNDEASVVADFGHRHNSESARHCCYD